MLQHSPHGALFDGNTRADLTARSSPSSDHGIERLSALALRVATENAALQDHLKNRAQLVLSSFVEQVTTKMPKSSAKCGPQLLGPEYRSSYDAALDLAGLIAFQQLLDAANGSEVDLAQFFHRHQLVMETMQRPSARMAALRELSNRSLLKPAPKAFWCVNRTLEQVSGRCGFNIRKYLQLTQQCDEQEIWVEWGGGNGACKHDRQELIATPRLDVSVMDTIYYQIDELLECCIDWDAVDEALKARNLALSKEMRKRFCWFLSMVLVIEAGRTAMNIIAYDKQVKSMMEKDPNAIVDILRTKAKLLPSTDTVPDENGEWDSDKIQDDAYYPEGHKFKKPDDQAFHAVCKLFASEDIDQYLVVGKGKKDVYEKLPVHLEGSIICNFTKIRFRPKQSNFVLGSRASTYVPRRLYPRFVYQEARLLTLEGLSLNDDVRDNFGNGYRVREIAMVQEWLQSLDERTGDPPMQIWVICGKGQEAFEEDVPVARIMSRSEPKLAIARQCLYEGYRLCSPEELTKIDNTKKFYSWKPWNRSACGDSIDAMHARQEGGETDWAMSV